MNEEIAKLTKTFDELQEQNKLKDEEASILIAEKNSLDELRLNAEEKTVRFMKTVEKLYNENNKLKKELEQKKNTIELMNDGKNPPANTADEPIKTIKEKLQEKTKKLEEATNDKKRLAKDLAKAEEKLEKGPSKDARMD